MGHILSERIAHTFMIALVHALIRAGNVLYNRVMCCLQRQGIYFKVTGSTQWGEGFFEYSSEYIFGLKPSVDHFDTECLII